MKRIIAAILTLSICLSLAPVIPFASAADEDELFVETVYSFVTDGTTLKKTTSIDPTVTGRDWYSINTRNWKGFDVSDNIKQFFDEATTSITLHDVISKTDVTWIRSREIDWAAAPYDEIKGASLRLLQGMDPGLSFSPALKWAETLAAAAGGTQKTGQYQAQLEDAWFALKLDAPETRGTHELTFKFASTVVPPSCDIFFAPYEAGEDSGSYYIQDINRVFSGSITPAAPPTIEGLDIGEATHYILVVRLNGANVNNKLQLANIKLRKKLGKLQSAVATLDESSLTAGEYTYASVSALDTLGEAFALDNAEITYKSSDSRIADVDEKTGEVYAKRGGECEIYAEISAGGVRITSAGAPLSVTAPADAESLPDEILAGFALGYIEVGTSNFLKVTDADGNPLGGNIELTYEIDDDEILAEDDGKFTALKMGRADVTVTASLGDDEISKTVSVAVVGENLFTRHGVRHGEFERGVYFNDNSYNGLKVTQALWQATRNLTRDTFDYEFLDTKSEITGKKTRILKLVVDDKPNLEPTGIKIIRIEQANLYNNGENEEAHNGLINMEIGKIYEFTGLAKIQNVKTFPEILINPFYYKRTGTAVTSYDQATWQIWEETEGDKPWTIFGTDPIYVNWDAEGMACDATILTRVTNSLGSEMLLSNLAFHEVTFDKVNFLPEKSFEGAKTFDTFKTTAVAISGTGKEIVLGDPAKPFAFKYSTSDPLVATVDDYGTITAVGNGECEVYADLTIGGVPQRGVISVSLSGLDVKLNEVVAEAPETLEVGASADVSVTCYDTTGSEVDMSAAGNMLLYESENPAVAAVDENGKITAKASGTTLITVYAVSGDATKKTSFSLSVTDGTPLERVVISGNPRVEKGFSEKLSARAYHTSGMKSYIDGVECTLSFSPATLQDAEYLDVSADGTVSGKKEGNAGVIATVTKDGQSVDSEVFFIEVIPQEPKDKVYDFQALPENVAATAATVGKLGWELDLENTSNYIVSNVSKNPGLCCNNGYAMIVGINSIVPGREADTVINISVDYDGWYEPSFMGALAPQGGYTHLYIDGQYIGDYGMYGPQDTLLSIKPVVKLNPVFLKKGIHKFKVRTYGKGGENGIKQYLRRLSLKYLEEKPQIEKVETLPARETLAVGESLAYSVVVALTSGGEYVFGPDDLGNESGDAGYELVLGGDALELRDGKLRAALTGSSTAGVRVWCLGDEAESETCTITVTDEKIFRAEFGERVYQLKPGETAEPEIDAYLESGAGISADDFTVSYDTDENIVKFENGKLVAVNAGETMVRATVTLAGNSVVAETKVIVLSSGFTTVSLSVPSQVIKYGSDGFDISVAAFDDTGKTLDVADADITFESNNTDVVEVSSNGHIFPREEGTAEIAVAVTLEGVTRYAELSVSVRRGKVAASFYTPEKIVAARENVQKYKWAKELKDTAVKTADKYLQHVDLIYDSITSDGLPRAFYLCKKDDPEPRYCRYCGCDVWEKYGRYGFKVDPLARAWKVQCPDCKRLFPSNDFESFYKLALNERGEFDRELGLKRHQEMFGGTYGYGYLKNDLYSELRDTGKDPRTGDPITHGWGKLPKEPENIADVWGVDDGFGYETGRLSPNGTGETHAYIPYYNFFGIWLNLQGYEGLVHTSLKAFRDAYIYTGDEKYGIAGAKLIDRVADFYPDYDTEKYYGPFFPSVSGFGDGKILGNTWDAAFFTEDIVDAYDVFFDLYDRAEVVSYLAEKAEKYGLENDKRDGEAIRRNIEENFLIEIFEGTKRDQFAGNYGFKQDLLSKAAIVLDTQPKTQEMIDFVMQNGTRYASTAKGEAWCTGGNVLAQIVDVVTRDGFGNESTMGYNSIWPENLLETAQNLNSYAEVAEEDNLLKNPKFIKMLKIYTPTRLAGRRRANIGDDGGTAGEDGRMNNSLLLAGWQATKDPYFAQCLYLNSGGALEDLHYDVFTKNPESIQDEVNSAIEAYGEYDESKSSASTGYGFAALRDGTRFESRDTSVVNDTMRDWWMYFGTAVSHKHHDGMNLGIDAYGLNMAPDHGYPAEMTGEGAVTRTQWTAGTVSHNTVVVNDEHQTRGLKTADLLHFDDSGEVKVMDADGAEFYPMHTSTYRRTVVSVDVDDTVSYALDFFRVVGGDEHVYSFHSQSEKANMEGVTMVPQPMGTYAGADIPFGDTTRYKLDNGYNWLYNVERAKNPKTGTFMADFKVERLRPAMKSYPKKDWHLRLTMLNDFEVSEVALADGKAPTTKGNPEKFRYLLVRRSGENLDTLFTTALEPYIGQSAIESLERVEVTRADGKPMSPSEPVAAIKVKLNSGRCDYVIYAANNEVTYNVGELFEFCGFVGVYTLDGQGEVVRSYLMDGTKLGQTEAEYAALKGRVKGFTQGLPKGTVNEFTGATEYKSFIELELDEDYESLDCNSIIGNVINIKNDGVDNGSYIIESAEKNGRKLTVGVGDVSLIRSHKASSNKEKEYIYNIAEEQVAQIPLATYKSEAPEFTPVADAAVSAGSSISIPISATSESGKELTLSGTVLPRGMSLNKETGVLTWKPDDSQVGDNHVAVTASDGDLASTVRFTITVYGRTTGTGTSTDKETSGDKEVTGNSGAAGSGGSGGGGGAAPSDKPDDTTNTDQTDTSDEKDDDESLLLEEKVPSGDEADEVEKPQFTDLGNHSWAADAINTLAAADIIRGTSETTFAPAANITRADFALLLVRAFNLTSDNAENFADVSASDYFATELAIARNTGIVNGIGDNKFAPRNHITRQDMMVIVYRALQKLNVGFGIYDEPQYPDFDTVAPYAKEAVTALIGAGLVNGKNNLIAPTDYTTRAEVAVLIKRILDYVKK
ncbi:MAG: hypothetical protein E7441_02885 [Ruminococcaceae bacterium]|nr:hypothetical protein [Oscillospiraceae bacterium]